MAVSGLSFHMMHSHFSALVCSICEWTSTKHNKQKWNRKRKRKEKEYVTHQVLSCTHQNSHCQPVSKWHRRRRPWWRFWESEVISKAHWASCSFCKFPPLCYYSTPYYYACRRVVPCIPLAQQIFSELLLDIEIGSWFYGPLDYKKTQISPFCMLNDVITLIHGCQLGLLR